MAGFTNITVLDGTGASKTAYVYDTGSGGPYAPATVVGDGAGNKQPAMDAIARPGFFNIVQDGAVVGAAAPLQVATEFAAALALGDAMSNPTTSPTGANLLMWNGSAWTRPRVPSKYVDENAVTITTITTVWTPGTGKKFRFMGGSLSVSAAMSLLFEDNSAGNTVFRTPQLVASSPYNFDIPGGFLSAAVNNVLKCTGSAAGSITGTIWGTEE